MEPRRSPGERPSRPRWARVRIAVHGVAELVEESGHFLVVEKRRGPVCGRGEVAEQRRRRPQVGAAGKEAPRLQRELREMVVLSLPREHVEVEQAHRLPALRVGDPPQGHAVRPHVGRLQLLEPEPEDRLVDREHAPEHVLVGEIDPQRLRIDRVLLLDDLVLVVAPVGEDRSAPSGRRSRPP
jgi:hypothetical protein